MNSKIDWLRLVGIVVMAALLVAGTGRVVLANDAMDARHLVDKARITLDSFDRAKDMSAFRDLLKDAKGVFIAPQILKGAFIVGASGGSGVFMVKELRHRPRRAPAQARRRGAARLAPGSRPGAGGDRRALQRAHRRHRRRGRGDDQPDARGRGLAGRTLRLEPRPDRALPEVRRGVRPRADRAHAGRPARDPDRRRGGRRARRLRSSRRGRRRGGVEAQCVDARRDQLQASFRPPSSPATPTGASTARR